ncbi:hypothetical protein [Acidiphilium acidophilum]|uniref:Uncharacterized protein n=1 Tax=Acidiphilium acidophilum TaxID=76588 RepID=A0AAW9DK84_ACIAO|nr:hypothetical protein [Acidiphilium acidophilum]MDX5929424.1 hypothetical protein [Acidiphilium acidophilum]GBR73881.1 hypothetical protein AA700_0183 [Acidiphilium acidophilum DSM 700]
MRFYKESTQDILGKLETMRETLNNNDYALGIATIKANDFVAYTEDVLAALGKARNFYWTYRGSQNLVRSAYHANRPVAEVAAELLELRKQDIARQRKATRELNRRMGWA